MNEINAVLEASFDVAHMVFNAVVNDIEKDVAAHRVAGGMVPSAAAIVAHALFSEDMVVNAHVRRKPQVFETGSFGARTGITAPGPQMTPEWVALPFDMDGLKEYAAAVFAATSAFLKEATPEELAVEIATPLGTKLTAGAYLAAFGVVHLSEHAGEVSALKGFQGLRGLPF